MCWNVHAAAARCLFWPLLRIRPSLARFSTVSICPRGHPRLLPLAGTDTSKSPNCDGQAVRLRRGVPLARCFVPVRKSSAQVPTPRWTGYLFFAPGTSSESLRMTIELSRYNHSDVPATCCVINLGRQSRHLRARYLY